MALKLGKVVSLFLITVSVIVIIGACAAPAEEPEQLPVEITDQTGRVIRLAGVPERIISLAPSNTEILYALGLGDKVVAVTDFCDYPEEAKAKPSVGSFSKPNIEEIIAQSPDLVVVVQLHEAELVPQLESRGITVLVLNPTSVNKVLEAIRLVGEVTGKEEEASRLIAGLENRIKTVADKTQGLSKAEKPGVFYIVWHDPLMSAGSGTLEDELIGMAGGRNIAGDLSGYASISLEAVIAANPEVMVASMGHGEGGDVILQHIESESRLDDTDAARYERIYGIEGDLISRSGPRIVDALEDLAGLIHPQLFIDN